MKAQRGGGFKKMSKEVFIRFMCAVAMPGRSIDAGFEYLHLKKKNQIKGTHHPSQSHFRISTSASHQGSLTSNQQVERRDNEPGLVGDDGLRPTEGAQVCAACPFGPWTGGRLCPPRHNVRSVEDIAGDRSVQEGRRGP